MSLEGSALLDCSVGTKAYSKKLLVAIVSAFLLVFLIPRSVFAEVVEVNSADYESLQQAVDAIDTEGTIKITGDVHLEKTATYGRAYAPVSVVIPAGKHITITDDGQKRTIFGADKVGMFAIEEGATLTIQGSSDANLILQSGDYSHANGFCI